MAALPVWWDNSLWDDPASRLIGYSHLSRHLGIDFASLQDATATPRLKQLPDCRYKMSAGTTVAELQIATVIATRAAQLAIAASPKPVAAIPPASELRTTILETAPWVGFEGLLDWCWTAGIPVLHVTNFPRQIKKPTGFTLRAKGRPAIVLCGNHRQPARQLFVLAHELGHLHHGHVSDNGALLDETIHENEADGEERQADSFANDLLRGRSQFGMGSDSHWYEANELAALARDFGLRNQVDPGHAILHLANGIGSDFYPIASAALKLLHPDANAVAVIGERLAENLDWSRLPEDSSVFLMRMTGREIAE